MPASSQIRNFTLSQLKLVLQLQDYVLKTIGASSSLITLNKELLAMVKKLPTKKFILFLTKSTDRSITNIKVSTMPLMEEKRNAAERVTQTVKFIDHANPSFLGAGTKTADNNTMPVLQEEEQIPKWKVKRQDIVSKSSIDARTRYVVSAVQMANSNMTRLQRIKDLSQHLMHYPQAKGLAVKEGAIPSLLRLRRETCDEFMKMYMRECLSLLGYTDPVSGQGIRILSIDGGGIRGLLALEILRQFERITGKPVYKLFDYICGVSTGAILAYLLGVHKRSIDECEIMYKEISTTVFTQSTFWGTKSLVWSHAYYDTSLWEKVLQDKIGSTVLIETVRDAECPKISAISCVVNQAQIMAYIFRNYSFPFRVQPHYVGGSNHRLWEAVRATAAAPGYFEEFRLRDFLHQDGGILVNNPCAVAIHEAKQLWPHSPLQCVISLGTGRYKPVEMEENHYSNSSSSSWKNKFLKILDSATDTEGVHTILNDLLPAKNYYRFNPYLSETVSLDEVEPIKLQQMKADADMYIRKNEAKIQGASDCLMQPKTVYQKLADWLDLQQEMRYWK